MNLEVEEKKDRRMIISLFIILFALVLIFGGIIIFFYNRFESLEKTVNRISNTKIGVATWYAKGVNKDGTKFTGNLYSGASNYFERYSLVLVENINNGRKTIVWINDTHESTDIVIDLSKLAFGKLAKWKTGKIPVRVINLGLMPDPNEELFGKVQRWKK